jgi:similar to spore coat protein
MHQQGIAPHESIELHELLTFKNVCLTKAVAMSILVSDDELKLILKQDADSTQQHIKELRGFIEQSSISKIGGSENI